MLRDLEKLLDARENAAIEETEIIAAAAALRRRQFIWQDARGQGRHYDLLVRFETYFRNLFGAFGDQFFVDTHYRYCGIIPAGNGPALKQLETIFLLVLAKLHDTEARNARTENGRTSPGSEILLDEYTAITGKEKPLQRDAYAALDRLAKYGVIQLGDINPETEMRTITILPSITRVVNQSFLDELALFSGIEDEQDTELTEDETDTETLINHTTEPNENAQPNKVTEANYA